MSGLAENLGSRILRKKKKGLQRQTKVFNFSSATTAYIIFDTSVPECFPVIKDFRKFLKSENIKAQVIGIVSTQKEVPQEMLFWNNYDFITKKDKNWFKKPKGEVTEKFLNTTPDILFDFTLDSPLEVQFLVQLSKAQFKIGCFTEADNDYDLMINPTGKCDLEFFVQQVKHYVSILNPS